MAETMLYVNEHLHDQLWDGAGRPELDPQLRPRRLPRVHRGRRRAVSSSAAIRPSGGRSSCSLRALGLERPGRRPPLRRRRRPAGQPRRALRRAPAATRRRRSPTPPTFEERFAAHRLASGRAAQRRASSPRREWAAARGAIVDGARPRRRDDPHPELAVALQRRAEVGVRGEPRYRGEDNRAVLAELLGYDDATHRRARSRRRAVEPAARRTLMLDASPVAPMKATLGTLPGDDDGVGVRDQVGRLPHAGVRRRRARCGCRARNLLRRHRQVPGAGGPAPTRWRAERAILDGELVVLDDDGRPRFELIQRHERQAALFVFDVLADRRPRRDRPAVRGAPAAARRARRAGRRTGRCRPIASAAAHELLDGDRRAQSSRA